MENKQPRQMLNGQWRFRLDPEGAGEAEGWQQRPELFTKAIQVPGPIQGQDAGFGTRRSETRAANDHESFTDLIQDFTLTPTECYCDAWYMRDVDIPSLAGGQRLWLAMEGVHPYATVWLDGARVGRHEDGPYEPFRVELTAAAKPGRARLAVRVEEDGRLLQGVVKWPYYSGITRDVYLETTDSAVLGDVHAKADAETGAVEVLAELDGGSDGWRVSVAVSDGRGGSWAAEAACAGGRCAVRLSVPSPRLWSPESPALYSAAVRAWKGAEQSERLVRFGFRRFSLDGRQLLLNGKPLFLRGTGMTLPCCGVTFQNDPGYHGRLVRRAKEHGFNYLRCHTSSFERELLEEADRQGILIQSELFSVFYETPEERRVTRRQCELMLRRNRSHPSVCMFVMGNEHESSNPDYIAFRDSLCGMAREMSPDTLVADSDGVFGLATASHDMSDVVMAGAGNGIGGAFDMGCYARDQVQKHGKPCVVHEFGYPESFPNTADIPRYDQNLRPFWLRHTLEKARAAGAERLLPLYVENSRKLHFQIVRRAIEDMRTVDGLGGYGHWGFMDFVHESIGLVDVFLGDKAGSAEAFARSNGPVALSVKPDCGRMTGFAGQDYGFAVYLSSHGAAGRAGARALRCSLEIGGVAVSECAAEIELRDFGVARAEGLALRAPAADLPCHATLRAEAPGVAENSWDVWLFPRRQPPSGEGVVYLKDSWQTLNRLEALLPGCRGVAEAALWKRPPADVLVTAVLSGAVSDYLRRGGKVVLLPMYYANSSNGLPMLPSSFAPAPSFAGTQGACGTVVSEHPCLDGFPHQGWCDYQFYDLLSGQRMPPESVPFHNPGVQAFDLTPWPSGLEPIIRSIPNWKTCANRAYMFECRVGEGRLLACSLRVLETATLNPESAWLLGGIADYARGGSFAPKSHIGHADFEKLRAEASYTRL